MQMTLLRLAPIAALLALTGCGAGTQSNEDSPSDQAGQESVDQTEYQGTTTVLENADHGPQLAGITTMSLPPQGGGMDIANWDWESVDHEEQSGTRWGSYLVTGTFDGESFVLTEGPVPSDEVDTDDYPDLDQSPPETPEPSESLSESELDALIADIAERFDAVVDGGRPDADAGVAWIDTTLVTPELEEYAAETYPEGTYEFTEMLVPVS